MATAHLCGPPVPGLTRLSYRPCGEVRRAQLSAWSWMRKQRLQGLAWFPGGTARRWLGWNASPVSDVRSQQWSVLRGSSKDTQRRACLQTAASRQLRARKQLGGTGSEQRGGRRWGQSLRGAQTPGCCQEWSQGNCSAPTGQAEQREASRPGYQGAIAQHRGRCPGHV